ncbi:MAG: hypothetical protein K2L54_04870 [Clostridiales bacterium]|nr:hypothetical protein [Clostridiales bacterium]
MSDIPRAIEVNGKRFSVLKLLGKGKGGYSYLVTDGTRQYVLKQIHHEPCSYYTFGNKIEAELNDYKKLSDMGIALPRLIDCDVKNERILKEFIDGDVLSDLIERNELRDDHVEQIRAMCRKLYAAGLNIDYYPTNFVAVDGVVYYIDYECNEYSDEWNFENWGERYYKKQL